MRYTIRNSYGNCLVCGQYVELRFGLCFTCCTETVKFDYDRNAVILDDGKVIPLPPELEHTKR